MALAERAVLVVGAHAPPVILLKHLLHSQIPAAIRLTAFFLVNLSAKPARVSHSLRDFVFLGDFSQSSSVSDSVFSDDSHFFVTLTHQIFIIYVD